MTLQRSLRRLVSRPQFTIPVLFTIRLHTGTIQS